MTITNGKAALGFALAGTALTLGGCGNTAPSPARPKSQSAVLTVDVDESASTAFITSPAYTKAAIEQVGQSIMQLKLGDSIRVLGFGNRSADNALDVLSEKSGYNHRLPAVRKDVEAALTNLMDRNRQNGGDGSTNITYALEAAHIDCASGADHVIILSDGVAEDERYSAAKALAAGKPIQMPPPSTPYLKGCSVEFIGIGMTPQSGNGRVAQTLPNDRLQALIAGWREYLAAAGVKPDAIRFRSIL